MSRKLFTQYKTLSFSSLIAVLTTVIIAQSAFAAFNKHLIISNGLFVDTDSLSLSEINNFIDDEGGDLLANWVDNVNIYMYDDRFPNPNNRCLVHKATGMTAAEIIHQAANDWQATYVEWRNDGVVVSKNPDVYNGPVDSCTTVKKYTDINLKTVSPKVIFSTLEKEQSIVTADGSYSTSQTAYDNPPCNVSSGSPYYGHGGCKNNNYKLTWAMGYGFPDTGDTHDRYKGFYNQVMYGAWQLRFNYEKSDGSTSWDGTGSWGYGGPEVGETISIDGQSINVGNRATASLYYYTPHIHGNQNFVALYEQWFGNVNPKYHATTYLRHKNQSAFRGDEPTGQMWFENTGNTSWYDEIGLSSAPTGTKKVMLYTSRDIGRSSTLGGQWGSARNVASRNFSAVYESDGTTLAANQHRVQPGQIARYNITFDVPNNAPYKKYREYLQPSLFQSPNTFNDPGAYLDVNVVKRIYKSEVYWRHRNQDGNRGDTLPAHMWFKNIGNVPWYDQTGLSSAPAGTKKVMLYTSHAVGRSSVFGQLWGSAKDVPGRDFSAVYESNGTTLAPNQHKVEPGQVAAYDLSFVVPGNATFKKYREFFQPSLFQSPNTFNDPWAFLDINVVP